MRLRNIVLVWMVIGLTNSFAQQSLGKDSIPNYRLGLFDITTGVDVRYNHIQSNFINSTVPSIPTQYPENINSGYYGTFFRIQVSFIDMYANKNKRKFRLGDLISGEISLGYADSKIPRVDKGFLPLYNFEIGMVGLWHVSPQTDLSFSIALMKFGKDYLSEFFGGSNYFLRIRHKRFLTELGWISENKLYFGAFNILVAGDGLSKASIALRYFIKPYKNFGIRFEMLPLNRNYDWWYGSERTFSLKIFYGVNF